ncbi:hypothetical protein GIB67_017201, partial [Kingdonia uniflora]
MVYTRDQLKQTKKILMSPLKIYQKSNSKKKANSEMNDFEDRLMKETRVTRMKIEILVIPIL